MTSDPSSPTLGYGAWTRMVARSCPNVRADGKPAACNCSGACQPLYVRHDDPRTDEEVRADLARLIAQRFSWMGVPPQDEGGAFTAESSPFRVVLGREATFTCPACGESSLSVTTAYGQRAVCCGSRWTRIITDEPEPWVREKR